MKWLNKLAWGLNDEAKSLRARAINTILLSLAVSALIFTLTFGMPSPIGDTGLLISLLIIVGAGIIAAYLTVKAERVEEKVLYSGSIPSTNNNILPVQKLVSPLIAAAALSNEDEAIDLAGNFFISVPATKCKFIKTNGGSTVVLIPLLSLYPVLKPLIKMARTHARRVEFTPVKYPGDSNAQEKSLAEILRL